MFPLIKHIQRICKLTLTRERSSNWHNCHLCRWYRRVKCLTKGGISILHWQIFWWKKICIYHAIFIIHQTSVNTNTNLQVYLICSYHYNHFYMDDEKDYQSYSIPFVVLFMKHMIYIYMLLCALHPLVEWAIHEPQFQNGLKINFIWIVSKYKLLL